MVKSMDTAPQAFSPPLPIAHLDLIRGVAALLVFASHWRNLLFVPLEQAHSKNLALFAWYALTGFGHQAVLIFFVLSGFLITHSAKKAQEAGGWRIGNYAIARLSRLYVVLIPALLLGLVLDSSGSALFGVHSLYSGRPGSIISDAVANRLSASIGLQNLLFLQDLRVPSFGSNRPLWSLSYEAWYYAIFPALWVLGSKKSALWKRLMAALIAFGIVSFIGRAMVLYFAIWLLGAALALWPQAPNQKYQRRFTVLAGALGVAALLGWVKLAAGPQAHFIFASDFLLAIAFTAGLYLLLGRPAHSPHPLYALVARHLAGCSYTLYLTHVPALVFLSAWLLPIALWQPDAWHLGAGGFILCLVFAYAYGIAQLTEAHTGTIRAWLMHRSTRKKRALI
jgi:peptidoglycan/LPS O-acetylase OafA/YrhL